MNQFDHHTRRQAAVHEAGHVVLSRKFGLQICYAQVKYDSTTCSWYGAMKHGRCKNSYERASICLAGYAAESILRRRRYVMFQGHGSDMWVNRDPDVCHAVQAVDTEDSFLIMRVLQRVWRVVRRYLQRHWHQVVAVADLLMKTKRVTGCPILGVLS